MRDVYVCVYICMCVCVTDIDKRGGGKRINIGISLLKFSLKIKAITLLSRLQ